MAVEDDEGGGHHLPDRIWRMEQRQQEIIARLERLQASLDRQQMAVEAAVQRRGEHDWRVDQHLENQGKLLEDLLKRPAGGSGLLGEPTIIKMVLGALVGLIAFLAIGKAFIFPG